MLKTLLQLLGDDAHLLRRYAWMATAYGLMCGLTMVLLVPLLTQLLLGEWRKAALWLLALLVGVCICWLGRRVVEQAGVRVGVAVLQTGRHRLVAHLAGLPVGWFGPQNQARIGHAITQGMMSVAQLPAHVFTPLIAGLVTPLVLLVALWLMKPVLGAIALVALPLLALVWVLTSRMAGRADAVFQRDFAHASQRMLEFAQAQSVLRAFSGGGESARFLAQAVERQRQSGAQLMVVSALSGVLNIWVVQAVFAALLVAALNGLDLYPQGAVATAQMVAVIVTLLLVVRFTEPLLEVAAYADVLRSARAQLAAMAELFSVQPLAHVEAPHGVQMPADNSLELRDVHFRYDEAAPEVLHGVSLQIAPGSMTALVGASGSGKSTVMRLMARFFDATQGQVLLGGVDVRQMSEAQLAAQISQIFQDSYLFAGSIADNIRIGKPDASEAELLQAAQQAGVDAMLARLPQGLDTQVGENGARLSGGERQRIAIARALIKDAPILLVDEATAALDAENQAIIAQTLARLRGQRTLVVIAHQLSTVAMADQIVVLEAGRVVEQGAPAELQAAGGRYAQFLRQRQASKGWRIAPSAQREVS